MEQTKPKSKRRKQIIKIRAEAGKIESRKTTENINETENWFSGKIKLINSEYSFKGLLLKLKLLYFGHLKGKMDSLKRPQCWERLRAGAEGNRE